MNEVIDNALISTDSVRHLRLWSFLNPILYSPHVWIGYFLLTKLFSDREFKLKIRYLSLCGGDWVALSESELVRVH